MAKMAQRTLTIQLLPKRPHHVHHLPRVNAVTSVSICTRWLGILYPPQSHIR